MDRLPTELLGAVLAHLPVRDVKATRLACKGLAAVAFPLLCTHLSALNLLYCLDQLEAFLTSVGPLASTKKLTLYHGTWPVCTRTEWEVHPLQQYDTHPQAFLRDRTGAHQLAADVAYERYDEFIQSEASRDWRRDLARLRRILRLLPNLQTIAVSQLQARPREREECTQYARLRKQIWMFPLVRDTIDGLLDALFHLLAECPRVQELELRGRVSLRPRRTHPSTKTVAQLVLQLANLSGSDAGVLLAVLEMFPNLHGVSVGSGKTSRPGPPLALDGGVWHRLRTIALDGFCVGEDDLVEMMRDSQALARMALLNITLAQGTWRTFCSKARQLRGRIELQIAGTIDGLEVGCCRVDLHGGRALLLGRFLAEPGSPWPFD
ncbi:hypothetical protein PGQ11_010235 [Apiospora arundinis]|uniref:F-box domain-containing protein n=1 Tax=Apiospora arundinis TaxID=335852 RepID=A0ABR2I985_9PEZI